jgi:hypothetical protein
MAFMDAGYQPGADVEQEDFPEQCLKRRGSMQKAAAVPPKIHVDLGWANLHTTGYDRISCGRLGAMFPRKT